MPVTIYEIASRAGVSSSTVARVLRGDVKEASTSSARRAARIRRLAEEMGYQRNWRARAFSRCKTHAVGLFHTHSAWICEGTMGQIAGAFTGAMHDLGYHVVIVPYDPQGQWQELLKDGRFDGIAVSHYITDDARKAIDRSGLPRVLLMDSADDWSCAHTDDLAGAYAATRHLIELGHQSIGMYLHDSIRQHFSVADRRAGYERAMKEAGLGAWARFCHLPEERLAEMLLGPNRPTAVLCYCHVEAMAIYQFAWRNGLSIPGDLSVIAFNELQASRYMTPPLTVMSFNTTRIGRLGATMLVRQIDATEPVEPEHVILKTKLILRESTAAPRPAGVT
ncbi:MAG: LacI family DNA-binding transcriptional regulator [Pirellulales bacterium]|nr:LacI family DNA-binding transcriptional regulator [Pirellulales bacterium]